ncbi:hypothetical protein ASG42_30860 [Rhizobium sp. Leaf391]|nr:hypothetical protein ASG42_30860 [Rhizobium sp. Leaf391]
MESQNEEFQIQKFLKVLSQGRGYHCEFFEYEEFCESKPIHSALDRGFIEVSYGVYEYIITITEKGRRELGLPEADAFRSFLDRAIRRLWG